MHLRAGRWARRALPSLSPLSRALAPDAATPHAGRSEATTEGSRAGPGPQPPGFADGRREEPPLAARTPVLPAALLAASKASKGTGGGCAVSPVGRRRGVQGTSPPPVGGRVSGQKPRRPSRCTWKTWFPFWSYQNFSGKRQERPPLILGREGVFTAFSRPCDDPGW